MEQEKPVTVAETDPTFSYFPTKEAVAMLMDIIARQMNEHKEHGTRPSMEFTNIDMQVCFGLPTDLLAGISALEQRLDGIERGMCERCRKENVENGNEYTCHGVQNPGDLLRCFMATFAREGYQRLLTEAVEAIIALDAAQNPSPGHAAGAESVTEFVKKHIK